jgi:hypothetical protein
VVAAAALPVVQSALLIFVPLALMLVALPPRRPALMVAGVVVVGLLLTGPAGDPVADYGRGWALVLGAWFMIAVVMMERAGFLARGLFAVAATAVTAASLLGLRRGSFSRLDAAVAERLQAGVERLLTGQSRFGFGEEVAGAMRRMAELEALLYPALLAVASLAALAVAWWAYRRLAVRDGEPLRPLREFRFHDGLVWLLIAGVLLLVLPLNDVAERTGSNLLAFMAVLYAVRGAAVLLFVGGVPGPIGWLVVAVVGLVLYPLVMGAAMAVGLTDTWLDIRTRRPAGEDPES